MRKRSKYRPKPVLRNPIGYVIESMTPVVQHTDGYVMKLQVRNHLAMANLTRGKATKQDINELIGMVNMTEALWRLGLGKEYKQEVNAGLKALFDVATRGATTNKFILRAEEMKAINTILELHDAQLEIATVKDIERGIALVEHERKQNRMMKIGV